MLTAVDLYDRVKGDVVRLIQGLDLDGLEQRVVNCPLLDGVNVSNLSYPCVVVTSEGEAEELVGGTTQSTHKLYPVRVFLLDREALRAENATKYTRWRKQMIDALHERGKDRRPLPGCTEVCGLKVLPRVIFDPKQGSYQLVVSGFVVKAEAFEGR